MLLVPWGVALSPAQHKSSKHKRNYKQNPTTHEEKRDGEAVITPNTTHSNSRHDNNNNDNDNNRSTTIGSSNNATNIRGARHVFRCPHRNDWC